VAQGDDINKHTVYLYSMLQAETREEVAVAGAGGSGWCGGGMPSGN